MKAAKGKEARRRRRRSKIVFLQCLRKELPDNEEKKSAIRVESFLC